MLEFDLQVTGFGELSVITPLNASAKYYVEELIAAEPEQWKAGGLWVSSECIPEILESLRPFCKVQGRGGSTITSTR